MTIEIIGDIDGLNRRGYTFGNEVQILSRYITDDGHERIEILSHGSSFWTSPERILDTDAAGSRYTLAPVIAPGIYRVTVNA